MPSRMCGRYALKIPEGEEFFDTFAITGSRYRPATRFDVRPGTPVDVVRLDNEGKREMAAIPWMFHHGPDRQHPNAKGENLKRVPAYRENFPFRRCIVPATGYYEWKEIAPKVKQRFYFTRRDGQFIAFPALYTEKEDQLATITAPPSEDIATVHDRMPVILEAEHWKRYLDPEPLSDDERKAMIATSPAGLLQFWPVANKATGEELTRPIDPPASQADLFA